MNSRKGREGKGLLFIRNRLSVSAHHSALYPPHHTCATPIAGETYQEEKQRSTAEIISAEHSELRLEKSNIILLGPTGVGKQIRIA